MQGRYRPSKNCFITSQQCLPTNRCESSVMFLNAIIFWRLRPGRRLTAASVFQVLLPVSVEFLSCFPIQVYFRSFFLYFLFFQLSYVLHLPQPPLEVLPSTTSIKLAITSDGIVTWCTMIHKEEAVVQCSLEPSHYFRNQKKFCVHPVESQISGREDLQKLLAIIHYLSLFFNIGISVLQIP